MIRKFEFQISLVSHYGNKNEQLEFFIKSCQNIISKKILSNFHPYDIFQVHGTVIGLETYVKDGKLISKNKFESKDEILAVDFDKTLIFVKEIFSRLDLQIQIGGFNFQNNCKFTNGRAFDPYEQSFSIKGNDAIIKGWQLIDKKEHVEFPIILDELRRKFQTINFLHKYHKNVTDFDNDLFSVIGKVNLKKLSKLVIKDLEDELRQFISKNGPLYIPISKNEISMLFYVDSKMPKETTTQVKLDSQEFEKLNKEIIEDWIINGT